MADKDVSERLRALPSVDRVLQRLEASERSQGTVRAVLEELRACILEGRWPDPPPDAEAVAERVRARLASDESLAFGRVVNASGVYLHTGLGRAPLAASAARALARSAAAFTYLELDAASGRRDQREQRLLEDLTALTGAQAVTVVNNNAGAVLLALRALAHGREVVVSRGELVEIGGGFRIPEVMAMSGARLVEVGTTNRTYVADYERATGPDTALLLRVHTSNYRVVGFQHTPERRELVDLARRLGVPLLEDIGSGLLRADAAPALVAEPDAAGALAEGVDLLTFSGDKLLGGPQAGVLLGRAELVARCRADPLFRALRPDRLCLAALAETLRLHRQDAGSVPVVAALAASPRTRLERARTLASRLGTALPELACAAVVSEAQVGSGSAPARPLKSAAVELSWPGREAEQLARGLRTGRPPVLARVHRGRLQLDVLALLDGDEDRIERALRALA